MSYTYDDLPTLLREITDAAIESDMLTRGFHGNMQAGFDGSHVAPSTGPEGEYRSPWLMHVSPSGEMSFPDQKAPSIGPDDFIPSRDVWSRWEIAIPGIFYGWKSLPNPATYTTPVSDLRSAATQLFAQALVEPGGKTTGGNSNLGDISYLNDQLTLFQGSAAMAFHRYYASQLPLVISGQGALAHALYWGMAAEQEVWSRTREDVVGLAVHALAAMKAARPAPVKGPTVADVFKVLGAVAAAAGLVATDGAAAPFIAGAGTVIGIIGAFVPGDDPPPAAKPIELGGPTPDDVSANLSMAFSDLNTAVCDQEHKIAQGTRQSVTEAYKIPDSFNLGDAAKKRINETREKVPDPTSDTNPSDYATANDLQAHWPALQQIATSVLPTIGRQLTTAQKDVAAHDGQALFTRPSGIGESPYAPFHELAWHLENVLHDSAFVIDAVADQMEIVANDFKHTERNVTTDLRNHAHKVEQGSGAWTGQPGPGHRPG